MDAYYHINKNSIRYIDLPIVDIIDPKPDNKCRWPVGVWSRDAETNFCCGKPIGTNHPKHLARVVPFYCEEHASKATRPGTAGSSSNSARTALSTTHLQRVARHSAT